MKKIISLVLVLVTLLTLVGCGGGSGTKNNKAVEEYINKHGDELLDGLEYSFATSSGMTCTSSIKVSGSGFIISINIQELSNLSSSDKQQLQAAYDGLDYQFEDMLVEMKKELPELTYFTVKVCDRSGDVLATINAGK